MAKEKNLPGDDDGLIREVNEAMRQDKAKEWWDKFGMKLLLASGAIILLTAVFVLFQQQRHADQVERTTALLEALEQYQTGDLAAAEASLTPLAEHDTQDGITAIARLYFSHAQLRENVEGLEPNAFSNIAADAPDSIAALAAVQAAYAAESDASDNLATEWFGPAMAQLKLAAGEVDSGDYPQAPLSLQQRIALLESAAKEQTEQAE